MSGTATRIVAAEGPEMMMEIVTPIAMTTMTVLVAVGMTMMTRETSVLVRVGLAIEMMIVMTIAVIAAPVVGVTMIATRRTTVTEEAGVRVLGTMKMTTVANEIVNVDVQAVDPTTRIEMKTMTVGDVHVVVMRTTTTGAVDGTVVNETSRV